MAEQWPMERRAAKKRKIDKEAERLAGKVGADAVTIIAFFRDGGHMHIIDGGSAPGDLAQLYEMLASGHRREREASAGWTQ